MPGLPGGVIMQGEAVGAARGGAGVWIFRILLVAAAAFMVYSFFAPWWSAKLAALPGEDHLVLHPWGVEVTAQVRATGNDALYAMPWFFEPFIWVYFAACMAALAASLVVTRQVSIGRIRLPLATVLIGLVAITYLAAAAIAYGVGELRADWAGANFIGKSTVKDAGTGNKTKMVSDLEIGYWLAVGAGSALFVLALLRRIFVGKAAG